MERQSAASISCQSAGVLSSLKGPVECPKPRSVIAVCQAAAGLCSALDATFSGFHRSRQDAVSRCANRNSWLRQFAHDQFDSIADE